jgi:hypothetical protein
MYIYVCMHVYYTIYLSEVGQVLLISGIHGPDVQMQVTRPRVSVHLRVARKDAVHLLPDGGGHERTGPACSRAPGTICMWKLPSLAARHSSTRAPGSSGATNEPGSPSALDNRPSISPPSCEMLTLKLPARAGFSMWGGGGGGAAAAAADLHRHWERVQAHARASRRHSSSSFVLLSCSSRRTLCATTWCVSAGR